MFLFKKNSQDTDSCSSKTASRNSDILECVLICDSPKVANVIQQLNGYKRFIQKRIMCETRERRESLRKPTQENYPDYFYSFTDKKVYSFLTTSSKYEIKITGTLNALKSAVEALVFADYYDKNSCSLPPPLEEYADQLLRGDIPPIIKKIEFNY